MKIHYGSITERKNLKDMEIQGVKHTLALHGDISVIFWIISKILKTTFLILHKKN